jgi:thiamine biosynthesis protein ThiS
MEIVINGESTQVPTSLNLEELVGSLGLKTDRIAVELNRQIVRRDSWAATPLKDQDRLEIVHFVGGG